MENLTKIRYMKMRLMIDQALDEGVEEALLVEFYKELDEHKKELKNSSTPVPTDAEIGQHSLSGNDWTISQYLDSVRDFIKDSNAQSINLFKPPYSFLIKTGDLIVLEGKNIASFPRLDNTIEIILNETRRQGDLQSKISD